MVSEQETNTKPPMEVSQIHILELLFDTISNLIDLYKTNTNQIQNSYKPKNLDVGSKRTAAATTQANNPITTPNHIESAQSPNLCSEKNWLENSHAPLPENKERHPEPKKTYASALVDGGEGICSGLTTMVGSAPITNVGEKKEGRMAAVICNQSAASESAFSNTSRQQHQQQRQTGASASVAEEATPFGSSNRYMLKQRQQWQRRLSSGGKEGFGQAVTTKQPPLEHLPVRRRKALIHCRLSTVANLKRR